MSDQGQSPSPSPSPSELKLEATPIPGRSRSGRASVFLSARYNGAVIHADTIHLDAADDRRRFGEELLKRIKSDEPDAALTLAELEGKLLDLLKLGPVDDAAAAQPPVMAESAEPTRYEIYNGRLCAMPSPNTAGNSLLAMLGVETGPVPLCNFGAKILAETLRDDGAEQRITFDLAGALDDGETTLPRVSVPAGRFASLRWVSEKWGATPRIFHGKRAQVPLAIQSVSKPERTTIYAHLGWRRLDDERLVYLHSAGAIGADSIITDLEADRLSRYRLPTQVPSSELMRQAMTTSLGFLDLADPKLTYILWSLIWRAPLCEWLTHDVLVHVVGPSGRRKSTICAAMLAHLGDFAAKDDLPGSWDHTINALERGTFLTNDSIYVIDDLNPAAAHMLREDVDQAFARMAGNVGNQSGRRRLGGDLMVRAEYQPRGVVVSSGEYMPVLAESRAARVLPVPSPAADMDIERLSQFQHTLSVLPNAFVGYLLTLRDMDAILAESLRRQFVADRAQAMPELPQHARLAENAAQIALGLRFGLQYAYRLGVLDENGVQQHQDRGWQAIMDVTREHGQALQSGHRPAYRFLGAVREAIEMGAAYLAHRKTGAPRNGTAQGVKIGWYDDERIYLLPELSFKLAEDRLRHRGGIGLGPKLLHRELVERGLLRPRPDPRGILTSPMECEGTVVRTLWLDPAALDD